MTPSKKRRFIFDSILAAVMIIVILTSLATSALHLIFRPEREGWQIALDWISIVVTLGVVVVFVIGMRRSLKDFDRKVAEQAEAKEKFREFIRASRAEHPNTADVTVNPDGSLTAGDAYYRRPSDDD